MAITTPADIAGLLGYWDAGLDAQVTAGSAAATDGDLVARLNDQHTGANHLNQTTSTQRPRYFGGNRAGRPAIQFLANGTPSGHAVNSLGAVLDSAINNENSTLVAVVAIDRWRYAAGADAYGGIIGPSNIDRAGMGVYRNCMVQLADLDGAATAPTNVALGLGIPTSLAVVILKSDGVTVTGYVNGRSATATPSVVQPAANLNLYIGAQGTTLASWARVYGCAAYNACLTGAQCDDLTAYYAARFGINLNPTHGIIVLGDSRNIPYAANLLVGDYPWWVQIACDRISGGGEHEWYNSATEGKTLAQLHTDAAIRITPFIVNDGRAHIGIIAAGINDLLVDHASSATLLTRFATLAADLRTAGCRHIIGATIAPSSGVTAVGADETSRLAFNAALLASPQTYGADYVVDVSALAVASKIYAVPENNLQLYQTDATHFTSTMQEKIAEAMRVPIEEILALATPRVGPRGRR